MLYDINSLDRVCLHIFIVLCFNYDKDIYFNQLFGHVVFYYFSNHRRHMLCKWPLNEFTFLKKILSTNEFRQLLNCDLEVLSFKL